MGGGASSAQKQEGSITRWLESLNEAYRKYAKHFIEEGYETVALLAKQRDRAEVRAFLDSSKKPKVKGGH